MALLLAACSPSAEPTTSPSPSTSAPLQLEVVGYFVADTPTGFRLFTETRTIVPDDTYGDSLAEDEGLAAVDALLQGRLEPTDPDYTNLWGESDLLSYAITNQVITLDIATPNLNVGSESEMRAIEQLMWTFAANSEAYNEQKFEFLVNGEPVESFAGHVDLTEPLALPEAFESLNSVQLDFPTEGATVQSPVTFTGEACTFEANVAWRLYSSDGALVEKGFTMALAGCPTRSPFEFEVTIATPGEYEMRVIEYSMKNGKVRAIDTKTFTVE
ncbi:MAG: hypothetical protein RIS09_1079 [Actinomycetota bacterium]